MINVTKTFLPPFEEYTAVLKRAWNKGWITNHGELVQELEEISLNPKNETSEVALDEYHEIEINVKIEIKKEAERLHVTFVLGNETGDPIFTFSHVSSNLSLKQGLNHLKCILPKGYLNTGTYYLSFYLIQDSMETLFVEKDILLFNVQEAERNIGNWMGKEPGFIKPVFEWQSLAD